MSNDWAIKIDHLSKVYKIFDKPTDRVKEALNPFKKRYSKDFYALNDVSLTIKKGETVGIIGKNGAGKSTLLKIITGVLTPTSGNIQVNGRIASLLELGAGFNPEMTGIENVYMNGTIMGYTKEEMDERLPDIIDFADIGDFINQPVKMYSSGMFARLAFAVNVNVTPDILIVDEALSVGDEFFQQKCLYRMSKLREMGVTILFVSHSVGMIKSLCDRCVYVKEGKIIADGSAGDVCDIYQNSSTSNKKESLTFRKVSSTVSVQPDDLKYFRIDNELPNRLTERSGGKEMEFTAIDFYLDNNIVTSVEMLTPLHIIISGFTRENIPNGTALGVLCRDKLGNDIFTGNLDMYGVYLPEFEQNVKFVLDITYDVPLAPGEYFFGVGAKPHPRGSYFYDRLFNATKLTIVQHVENEVGVGGVVYAKLDKFSVRKKKMLCN